MRCGGVAGDFRPGCVTRGSYFPAAAMLKLISRVEYRYHRFGKGEGHVGKVIREFQIFAKPIGPLCNLDCRYCYYLEKEREYPAEEPFRMPDDLLEEYIVQHMAAAPGPEIMFSWHGGEPTLLGVDYFRKIVDLQRNHLPPGRRISNGIQTNGFLLDEEWARFFALERFRVGLSIDGPAALHDRCRTTRGGKPSHKQALQAYQWLRRYRVPCDILCVVQAHNVQYPLQVYRFFREMGATYLGFLPVVKRIPGGAGEVTPDTVPAEAFGKFLCTIFDEWVRRDAGRIRVQLFEEAARPAQALDHSLCIFRETCGDIPVVEHNGDFYSCDHYVDAAHCLGNLRASPLADLLESPALHAFGLAKRETLPRYCRECEVRPMCNGGCPKDRILRTPDGETGLNYLCAGWRRFFLHSLPALIRLTAAGHAPGAPVSPVPREQAAGGHRPAEAGRNDPCPCGSGLKHKKCCLAKR
jgi:uncharacterized protein